MDKDILYRFFDGTATEDELEQVRKWYETSPENQEALFRERKLFDAIMLLADTEKHTKPSKERTNYQSKPKRTIELRIPQIAAMLAVVFTLGLLAYPYTVQREKRSTAYYETIAPIGAKSQVTLTDGTKVWLNAGSRLLYATDYGQSNREVQLEGEAYFEVSKNNALPFDVKTSKLRIRAIGTAFNVKAYPDEASIETILVEGEVEVSRMENTNSDAMTLRPRQRLTLIKHSDEILFESKPQEGSTVMPDTLEIKPKFKEVVATTDFMVNTSWKDKRWRIESEELGSLATKLGRRYNVTFKFIDEELVSYKFNGTLQDEPIEEVLRALELSAPIQFTVKGNEVILSYNNKFQKEHKSLYKKQ